MAKQNKSGRTTRAERAAQREAARNNASTVSGTGEKLSKSSVNPAAERDSSPQRFTASSTVDETETGFIRPLFSRVYQWDGIDQAQIASLFRDIVKVFEEWSQEKERNAEWPVAVAMKDAIVEILSHENVDRMTRATGNRMLAELSDDPMYRSKRRQNTKVLLDAIEKAVQKNGLPRPKALDELRDAVKKLEKKVCFLYWGRWNCGADEL